MNDMDLFFVYLELNSVDKNGSDLKSILSCLEFILKYLLINYKIVSTGGDI